MSTKCPVCETTEGIRVREKRGDFSVVQCPQCGLQFGWPLTYDVTPYQRFYQFAYTEGHCSLRLPTIDHKGMVRKAPALVPLVQKMAIRWLKRNVPRGSRVFDVGFGTGWFLAAVEREGFDPSGLEVVATTVDTLKAKGFQVYQGSVENYPPDWPRPAAATSFEVLEHVTDPVGFLRAIRTQFPDAPLVLSVPSPKRWGLHLGGYEDTDYPPNHLTRWSEKSITTALQRAGYGSVSLLYPRPISAELFWAAFSGISKRFHADGYINFLGQRSGGRGFFRLLKTLRWLTLWGYDASINWVFPVLSSPLLAYFMLRGWSGYPVLAIANSKAAETSGQPGSKS
ncbi:MAG: methyltransferase domain-containing protein [Chloroflexi bacterium]|nr:methyltransferase domain-containing protein [Chloroflexota bacterium]